MPAANVLPLILVSVLFLVIGLLLKGNTKAAPVKPAAKKVVKKSPAKKAVAKKPAKKTTKKKK